MEIQESRREREFRRIEADLNRRIRMFPEPEEEQKSLFDRVVDNVVGRIRYRAAEWSLLSNYVLAASYSGRDFQRKSGFMNAAEAVYDKAVSVYGNYSGLRQGKAGQERRWMLMSLKLLLWDQDNLGKHKQSALSDTLQDMVVEMKRQGE